MVDNGSKDESIQTAKKIMPTIEIIDTGYNNGFAKGNNIGISQAFKDPLVEHVALINTDARLDKNWLEALIDFQRLKPRAACIQGTTLDYYNNSIIDSTHVYINHSGQAVQGHWKEHYYNDIGPKKIFGVNAAACLITRKFIEAQPSKDLFDESMFMYLEDVDIAIRATMMGWDNYLAPGATAYHMGSASSGGAVGSSEYGLYMTFRNNLGMILKNMPLNLIPRILIKMPKVDYDTVRHLRQLGQKKAANKVIKGRLVSLTRAPIYLIKRRKIINHQQVDADYLWYLMRKGY